MHMIKEESFKVRLESIIQSLDEGVPFGSKYDPEGVGNLISRMFPSLITNINIDDISNILTIYDLSREISNPTQRRQFVLQESRPIFPDLTDLKDRKLATLMTANNHYMHYISYDNRTKEDYIEIWKRIKERRKHYIPQPPKKPKLDLPKKTSFIQLKTKDESIEDDKTIVENIVKNEPAKEEPIIKSKEPLLYIKIESDLLNFEIEKKLSNESLGIFIKYLLEKM